MAKKANGWTVFEEIGNVVKKHKGEVSLEDFKYAFERWLGEVHAAESGSPYSQFKQ